MTFVVNKKYELGSFFMGGTVVSIKNIDGLFLITIENTRYQI
jgi:hypothetical protein